ncbi:hypothetical protein Poly21_55250 [Allorhodopirellula heiligendammensis]|uniref:Uncharacterized protein n=1 Tax=Allorhodopirellula heiligendammensis TaxID=2714739 RepID=A0A5C6BCW1_9BACT|nr:hypothetical protein Poly21_55250 [Allorhodopirellula heiligendammensis]
MNLLQYTVPSGLPCYGDWDFAMHPGTFRFPVCDLRDAFRAGLEYSSKYAPMWSKKSGIYRDHLNSMTILEWLESLDATGDPVTVYSEQVPDLFWTTAASLIYGGKFTDVICPECTRLYIPADTRKLYWTYGSGLAADGGHRLVCPHDHTLYSMMEWNS